MDTNGTTDTLNDLAWAWLRAKEAESAAIEQRRKIEDQILEVTQYENSTNLCKCGDDKVTIKITGRLDYKVDIEAAKVIALENGLEEYLNKLFRWKAEPNISIMRVMPAIVVKAFDPAINKKFGRPSFDIKVS